MVQYHIYVSQKGDWICTSDPGSDSSLDICLSATHTTAMGKRALLPFLQNISH